jgi:hypothetical protein
MNHFSKIWWALTAVTLLSLAYASVNPASAGSPDATAAGGKGPPHGKYSCDERKTAGVGDRCNDFTAAGEAKGATFMKRQCIDASAFTTKPCPSEGVVGSCGQPEGLTITRFYGNGPHAYTKETAKEFCLKVTNGKPQ